MPNVFDMGFTLGGPDDEQKRRQAELDARLAGSIAAAAQMGSPIEKSQPNSPLTQRIQAERAAQQPQPQSPAGAIAGRAILELIRQFQDAETAGQGGRFLNSQVSDAEREEILRRTGRRY